MKYYKVNDPDGIKIYSEDDIRTQYFPYWKERMERIGKAEEATFEKCVEDWIVVNWAEEKIK